MLHEAFTALGYTTIIPVILAIVFLRWVLA